MRVCFIGHKRIENGGELISLLRKTIVELINKGVTTFLFGSMSEFDRVSWETVTEIKKEHPFIKRVYVRSAYQDIDKSYEKYLLKFYEETYFPSDIENAGKYSYVERNYEMINNSKYCVFYYNENYAKSIKRRSGTQIAYEYAIKKKKAVINLYTQKKE